MYDVQVTITNRETGRTATRAENGLDEDEVRAQLKEWGQHLESGDDWYELYDEDEDEDECASCGELVEHCECEEGPSK